MYNVLYNILNVREIFSLLSVYFGIISFLSALITISDLSGTKVLLSKKTLNFLLLSKSSRALLLIYILRSSFRLKRYINAGNFICAFSNYELDL